MFRFEFDVDKDVTVDDGDYDAELVHEEDGRPSVDLEDAGVDDDAQEPCQEISLSDLMAALPGRITYSTLTFTTPEGLTGTLPRRDFYDARLQLLSSSSGPSDDDAIDKLFGSQAAPSDLKPGVYEGGMKTWECSVDLLEYLCRMLGEKEEEWIAGKSVLEIGCGTALPTVYLLSALFNLKATKRNDVSKVYLQDYNRGVLELMTLPNVLLAWYFSAAARDFRESLPSSTSLSEPGTLELSPALLSAFIASLSARSISLFFYCGSWAGFDPIASNERPFDLVLTSETIYRSSSLPELIRLLRESSSLSSRKGKSVETAMSSLTMGSRDCPQCLVAAKLVYFGVGGSVEEFKRTLAFQAIPVQTLWSTKEGLGRCILRVGCL